MIVFQSFIFRAYRFSQKSSSFPLGERISAKKHACLKAQYLLLLYETKTTDLTDDA
ncbi:hypothetical protein M2451_002879 [Dysgonomonas sp. PFB1-18]|uniref:hypothetical protein n=1 Tax=unclassified Dysgonomonas TaxID=2630389 RepID=UPI0013D3E6E9|nr:MULTISPECIES: hypothetical protein [unclassified Dysgonomonas]MDH6309989.1 hypothetical protein [Dysgonomonas sp. PF1-14]MDH6339898.1 hypothetical protein [Dysgonomonas sp. PF1-16]MDH6381546.1 hypothetical protein [Dysgonomonas sp. PFB1-18]MDH6398817.1 hypothetical protein [Dysgonomonas sp. PF1-23]